MVVGTTRGKRKLGALMEQYREKSGLKAEQIIKEVRTTRSTWSRMITGEARPRWALFFAILAVMKVSDEERERAMMLWEVADDEAVPIKHANSLPKNYLRFRRDESEAVAERSADAVLIPGMLQTAGYAAALAAGSHLLVPTEDWDEWIAPERVDRQALLHRKPDPLRVHALIDEAALRRKIGGPDVMRAQLDHLIRLAELPNITIQVIPNGLGAYGAFAGNFVILDFADDLGSVYFETLTGGVSVEDGDGVAKVREVWDDMAAHALSPAETVEVVRAVRGS
ncbi:helix-turn-helix domain-containing protein [Actinosynnema sp. NPDC059335]|uniref:helix-turn-helix domain-containing protein n=1 Tax=Actinosynnema sp. NPDC059335 TaxID=3346804 RepID=UPI00366B2C1F